MSHLVPSAVVERIRGAISATMSYIDGHLHLQLHFWTTWVGEFRS